MMPRINLRRLRPFLFGHLLLWVVAAHGQVEFVPSSCVPADSLLLIRNLDSRYQLALAEAPVASREIYAEALMDRHEGLLDLLRGEQFLFEPGVQVYVEAIFQEIIRANQLEPDPLILIGRSPTANALSLGNGIFIINVGLLELLSDRQELAFVFAHELAHDQLRHLYAKLDARAALSDQLGQREFRRQMKKAIRKGRTEEVAGQLQEIVYGQRRHSRAHEVEADSLGLLFLRSTGAPAAAAGQTLAKLKTDPFYATDSIDLRRALHVTDYPFKARWVKEEDLLFGGEFGEQESESFWDHDSLRTHPALDDRILRVDSLLDTGPSDGDGQPQPWVEWAARECAESYLAEGATAHALYTALKLLQRRSDDTYLHALVGRSLLATCQAIEDHDFDRCVPPPRYFDDPVARQVVRMLRQMRSSEMLHLCRAYLADKQSRYPGSRAIQTAFAKAQEGIISAKD